MESHLHEILAFLLLSLPFASVSLQSEPKHLGAIECVREYNRTYKSEAKARSTSLHGRVASVLSN